MSLENKNIDGEGINASQKKETAFANLKYLIVGIFFGIVFVKAEIISWFRIQEMFNLESFFMYGVIGSAVAVGLLSVQLIKKFNIKTVSIEALVAYRMQHDSIIVKKEDFDINSVGVFEISIPSLIGYPIANFNMFNEFS